MSFAINALHGIQFRHVQIGRNDTLHLPKLKPRQVVLCNGDIIFMDLPLGSPLPTGHAHVFFPVIGMLHDNFRCCLAMCGVVHLVLNGCENALCGRG